MNTSRRPPAEDRRRASSRPDARSGRSAGARGLPRVPVPVLLLLPALAVFALYLRTLGHAFVWDDLDLIVRNAALRGPDWSRLLLQDYWQPTGGGTGMWRPLVTLSFRLDGLWTGWQPWGFHLVNVVLHAASSVLLMRLALERGLPRAPALLAGLAFASAPALCEPVAWIAGRTDLLVVFGSLVALLAAARWRARASAAALGATLAGVLVALLAKESALVLPLLLAADAADARARASDAPAPPERARRWLPALAALACVLPWALAHRALVGASARPADAGAAAGMAALVWAHLAWLAPWAAHSPLLDLWRPPAAPVAIAAWLALAAVGVLAVVAARRRRPLLLVVALVLAPLLPVAAASLLESGVRFAERSLALPAAGLSLALAMLAASAPVRVRALAMTAVAAWVLLQGVVTVPLVGVWRDDEARIRRIAEVRPDDPDALLGMADLLSSLGRADEAASWIARAQALARSAGGAEAAAQVLVARASVEFRAGRLESALAAAEEALARDPGSLAAAVIRVRALARLARTADAVAAGEALAAAQPDEPAASGALGAARLAAGDAAGALPLLRDASAHLIEDAGLAWDLGRAAIATGDIALARTAFERAVAASPEFYEAWLGVADTRSRLGDTAGAAAALARAERLPGAADGRAAALRARIATR